MSEPETPPVAERPLARRGFSWRRFLVELGVVLLILFLLQLWLKRHMAVGEAPEFLAQDLRGERVSLAEHLGEGPFLLHFWASWCAICRLEEGMINRLAADDRVLTVAAWSGTAAEVTAYLEIEGLTMPTIADPDGRLAALYGVRGVPATFVVDGDGEIRFRVRGLASGPGLRLRLWAARWL